MEKDLQGRLDEIRAVARHLAAAKESYKDAFSRIDILAAELEQKRTLKGLKNGDVWEDDFSQFQEIEDIGQWRVRTPGGLGFWGSGTSKHLLLSMNKKFKTSAVFHFGQGS